VTLLSAHDDTLTAVLNTFQLQYGIVAPEYGSSLTFEVLQCPDTQAHFIKAIFDGNALYFAGNEHLHCPFPHVEQIISDLRSYNKV